MKKNNQYPFYKSLRFRFGLFFGLLFFIVLMTFVFVLYRKIRTELEQNFTTRLTAGAELVLQKTSINPLVIPLAQNSERFVLSYYDGRQTDTLYNNFAPPPSSRTVQQTKTLETGGRLQISYTLPDDELIRSLNSWQRLLFIYLPLAFLASLLLGYAFTGALLRPIRQIISRASATDLHSDIQLLPGSATADELHQLTDALNRMLGRIKHQVEEQHTFFASASHELRTPLSNMLAELQVLESSDLTPEMQAVIESQKQEVQRLIKLVNHFLLMSQLKADAMAVRKENILLVDACMNAAENLQGMAKESGQRFRLSVTPEEEDFSLLADRQQIEMILGNLLTNAVKYSRKNSLIEIALIKTVDGIQLSISNETDDIIENPERLGNRFYREGFYKEGFGLGLWIVRQLAEKNEGMLTIDFADHRFISTILFKRI
ncbi:MAG: hypothetical protein DI535_09185 [Citrobacter freundii]|nr:MAG: hypothetical protein DI535_09185 [Citrobacter freundii]